MKMQPMLIVMFVMYIIICLFDHTLSNNVVDTYSGTSEGMDLFNLIVQPDIWAENKIFSLLLLAVGTVTGITTLTGILTRSDILTLSGIAGVWFTLGVVPIVRIYSFVTRNVAQFACTAQQECMVSNLFGTLTVGILALMWLMSVVEWWFWRQTS